MVVSVPLSSSNCEWQQNIQSQRLRVHGWVLDEATSTFTVDIDQGAEAAQKVIHNFLVYI